MSLMLDGMECLHVFEEMQANGMPASRKYFENLYEELTDEMHRLQSLISSTYFDGRPFNPRSSDQVATLMRRRGLRGAKTTGTGKVSTSKKSIEHLRYSDAAIELVVDWREIEHSRDAFCSTILDTIPEGIDYFDVRCQVMNTRTAARRLATRDPNLLALPVRTEVGRKIRAGFMFPEESDEVLGAWDLCLAPGTRVLTANLLWLPIEQLSEGDLLIGIDENRPIIVTHRGDIRYGQRKLRTAVVEKIGRRETECKLIVMDNGTTIVASLEHPWLSRPEGAQRKVFWDWRKTRDLQPGDEIRRFADPWEEERTWEAGWLAGILDGEGCFSTSTGSGMITITQSEGIVLRDSFDMLKARGFEFHMPHAKEGGFHGSKANVYQLWICGMVDCMRILGMLRPKRLLKNAISLWEGREIGKRRKNKRTADSPEVSAKVVEIYDIGTCEVVSLQTSTRTFVAEGFFTHNSQIEMRVAADESGDENLCRLFEEGRDIHAETASKIFHLPLDKIDKFKHRLPSKNAGFGTLYGLSGSGLLDQLRMNGAEGWTEQSCSKLIQDWFSLYPGVKEYINRVTRELAKSKDAKVEDRWKMPRYLPSIWSRDRAEVAEAGRHAVSHRVQGGAQGMIQKSIQWLRPIIKEMQRSGLNVKWRLQVHDEIILSFHKDLWDILNDLILEALTIHHGTELRVPVEASGSMSKSWGSLK